MSYNNLETYYRLIFALQQHKWDPAYIENCVPYEREIYLMMVNQQLQEEEEKAKQKTK